ncbi:MAG: DUF5652 family protein [bacterium]|nr:DUF5652 family protein [bacterium]
MDYDYTDYGWHQFYGHWNMPFARDMTFGVAGFFFALLIIWSLAWKGMALWRAARRGERGWFIALLLIHTAGILDILYLYVFSKRKSTTKE